MKAYFISGLAADRRIFKYIRLPDGFEPVFLDWITAQEGESLQKYALRLAKAIDMNHPFILVGLSMGGMIASEIALHSSPLTTILLSSVPTILQLPPYMIWGGRIRLQRFIPMTFIKSGAIIRHLFSTSRKEDRQLLQQMIKDNDPGFIRWAMNAIVKWENRELPAPYIHIHGSVDKILPVRYTKPDYIIQGAGHLMVINRADEVNHILDTYLRKFAM